MTRNELPAVLNTELRALLAAVDAIEAEAREESRAQSIDARVRSLWPRIMPLCMALDHVAPRTRKPTPEAS